jgi:hypothetical protein
MRNLDPRERHKYSYPGGFRPDPILVVEATCYLAPTATATIEIVSCYPDLISHFLSPKYAINKVVVNKNVLEESAQVLRLIYKILFPQPRE